MKSFSAKIKTFAKTACVVFATISVAAFSGCDLVGSLFGGKEEEKEPDVVTVSPLSATIEVGATIQLTATSSEGRKISWVSFDDEIATVDGEGVVTGVAEGEVTITAKDGKALATSEITVVPVQDGEGEGDGNGEGEGEGGGGGEEEQPPVVHKVTISSTSITIYEGDSYNLIATASDGSEISWSSSDASVATVAGGKVTGIKEGTATVTASSTTAGSASCEVSVIPVPKLLDGYQLVWSDEFEGNSLDTGKWDYQTGIQDNYYGNYGPEYWGNSELQYYTNGANLKVSDGALQITAKREGMPNGRNFSSTRITTRDKYTTTYGYIEARMKTPAIEGMWPAFWMLPNPTDHSSSGNIYGGWPANGEIDIMEAKGRLGNVVDTTLHFGGPDWNVHEMAGSSTTLSSSTEEWHTYAVEWTDSYIAWIIDDVEAYRVTSSRYWSSSSSEASAPFDQPFYILLNLAVGGQYDSYREPPASFTQATMYVDYVRVYHKK